MYHSIKKKKQNADSRFTKDRQCLCTKNREPSLKQINKQKDRDILCFELEVSILLIYLFSLNWSLIIQCNPNSFSGFFKKLKSIIKCVWSSERAGPPNHLEKKE